MDLGEMGAEMSFKEKGNLMRKLGEAPRIPGRLENQSGIKEQGNWAKDMPVDVCLGYS